MMIINVSPAIELIARAKRMRMVIKITIITAMITITMAVNGNLGNDNSKNDSNK